MIRILKPANDIVVFENGGGVYVTFSRIEEKVGQSTCDIYLLFHCILQYILLLVSIDSFVHIALKS